MFESIKRIARNAIELNEKRMLNEILRNKGVQQQIIDLNQEQLRERHVRGDGSPITRYYSKVSREKFGKPNTPIILFQEGKFYASMKVCVEPDTFIISGNTIKNTPNGTLDISGYIGGNPMGLDEKSLSQFRDFVRPLFIEQTRKALLA